MFFGIVLSLVFLSAYVALSGYIVVRSWKSRRHASLISVLLVTLVVLFVMVFCYLVALVGYTQERVEILFWTTVTAFCWFWCIGRLTAVIARHSIERR